MKPDPAHYAELSRRYDALAVHGAYATQAPHAKGGRKAEYIAAVFDAALLPLLAAEAPHARLLDFGCGTGVFTRQAARHAGFAVGVDVSFGMLRAAQALCAPLDNVALLQIDGGRLPFGTGSFDRVVARESLCYVPEAELDAALAEIQRTLRPQGCLLWLEQVSDDPHWQRHPTAPHLIKRSPAAIRAAAARAGFAPVRERTVRTPRFPWIYPIAAGLLPRRAIPALARWETRWHDRFPGRSRRWWNALYVWRKET